MTKSKFNVGAQLKKHNSPPENLDRREEEIPVSAQSGSATEEKATAKRPGPKGRGIYKKRTIDLPPDLDEFVEEARRFHTRPNGQRSTAYSHFIEDMIAAERTRRANEASRNLGRLNAVNQ